MCPSVFIRCFLQFVGSPQDCASLGTGAYQLAGLLGGRLVTGSRDEVRDGIPVLGIPDAYGTVKSPGSDPLRAAMESDG